MSLAGRVEKVLDWIETICICTASVTLVIPVVTFGWLVFGHYVLKITPT